MLIGCEMAGRISLFNRIATTFQTSTINTIIGVFLNLGLGLGLLLLIMLLRLLVLPRPAAPGNHTRCRANTRSFSCIVIGYMC
jgi:hypothetical protein